MDAVLDSRHGSSRLEACPICASRIIDLLYTHTCRNPRARRVQVFTCHECHHGFVNPQLTWKELQDYYCADYRAYNVNHGFETADEEPLPLSHGSGKLRHVTIVPGTDLLDFGCGAGGFLRRARDRGARVFGIEPSAHAAAVARSQDIEVFAGTIQDYLRFDSLRQFDLITANHVLEHVHDPVEVLSCLKRLMRADGRLWIAVPNAGCWAARKLRGRWGNSDLPRHLHQFCRKSLIAASARAELQPIAITTHTLPKSAAGSIRRWLRSRCGIPLRLSSRVRLIDRLGGALAKRLDRSGAGEALLAEFAQL